MIIKLKCAQWIVLLNSLILKKFSLTPWWPVSFNKSTLHINIWKWHLPPAACGFLVSLQILCNCSVYPEFVHTNIRNKTGKRGMLLQSLSVPVKSNEMGSNRRRHLIISVLCSAVTSPERASPVIQNRQRGRENMQFQKPWTEKGKVLNSAGYTHFWLRYM